MGGEGKVRGGISTFNSSSSKTVLGMCIRQRDPRTRALGLFFACFVEQGRAGQGHSKNKSLGGREGGLEG